MNNPLITQALGQLAYSINQDRLTHSVNGDIPNYEACVKRLMEIQMELENHTDKASRIIWDIISKS